MRILLLGADGQLGVALKRKLMNKKAWTLEAWSREHLDVRALLPMSQKKMIRDMAPEIIINAIAYTDVVGAEEHQDMAYRVNADFPGELARWCQRENIFLIHYSTDFVFDGKKREPYLEVDEPSPLNVYGRSKLWGEHLIEASGCSYFIFRISWLYSWGRNNFLKKMISTWSTQNICQVVEDEWGVPNEADHIASLTLSVLEHIEDAPLVHRKLYHMSAQGVTSRYDFARAILKEMRMYEDGFSKVCVEPISGGSIPKIVARPAYSALSAQRLIADFHLKPTQWQDVLHDSVARRYDQKIFESMEASL